MTTRPPMTHKLKCWPGPFQEIWDGNKKFEVRKNDRDFRVGDELILREFSPGGSQYMGRKIHALVTHMMDNSSPFLWDTFLCVMSIKVTAVGPDSIVA